MPQIDACNRNLDIEVPAGEVEREYNRIAISFQRQAKIPGFRPGKAPLSMVRRHFDGKIREEMLEALVPAHLRSALESANLEPVSTPTVSDLKMPVGEALRFTAHFEVMPEIELGDYRAIRATVADTKVEETEVETTLQSLREREVTFEELETPASGLLEATTGMVAVATVTSLPGEGENAQPAAEASTAAEPSEVQIEVGGTDTLPEFTAALMGMSPGGERELEVAYPAEHPNKDVAGKTLHYKIQLQRLRRKVLPELSDEWVKKASGLENAAALRARIRSRMEANRADHARHEAEDRILDELIEQRPFPVPEALVEKQMEALLERRLRTLSEQGIDPRGLKLDWEGLRERNRVPARREVRIALALDRMAALEKTEATAAEVEAELELLARGMKQSVEALRLRLRENGMLDRIQNRIRQDKARAFLFTQATGLPFPSPTALEAADAGEVETA